MDYIEKLTEYFKRFPGIGEKQARRFVYFLLFADKNYASELSEMILEIRENISQCQSCYSFFPSMQNGDNTLCAICRNEKTDKSMMLVVEKDADLETIKQSGYKGTYFVLGGLSGSFENNKNMRADILKKMVETRATQKENSLKEIILAMSASPAGEHTDFMMREVLGPLSIKHGFKISSLGRGISTGTELEYVDTDTLKNALKNRG